MGQPTGFAAVNALGQNGTTGGAGGPTVEVDTAAEFIAAIGQAGPLTICVRGMITLPAGMHDVTSDKTIVGIGANSGITGGGLNIGLPVSNATTPPANAVHNVIIRNLIFRSANDDAINVQMFSHHVWIDHNDLAQGFDGLSTSSAARPTSRCRGTTPTTTPRTCCSATTTATARRTSAG